MTLAELIKNETMMKEINLLRAVGYARVSTRKQMLPFLPSIAVQKLSINDFVTNNPIYILECIYEDSGRSGKNMNRPGILALMERLNKGGIDVVLACRLDRISRDNSSFYEFEDFLKKRQIKLIYTNDINTGPSPSGNLMQSINLSAAVFEREQTSLRICEKNLMLLKQGYRSSGSLPIGYNRGENLSLIIEPVGAAHIRDIYDMFLSGKKPSEIAKSMIIKYKTSPERKLKDGRIRKGQVYTENLIYRILSNPIYAGYVYVKMGCDSNKIMQYELFEGAHDPIIARDEWEKSRKLLYNTAKKRKKQTRPLRKNSNYVLKGVLHCSCGHHMTASASGKICNEMEQKCYYVCTKKLHERKFCGCKTSISAPIVEGVVFAVIGKHFAQNINISRLNDCDYGSCVQTIEAELNICNNLKDRLQTKLRKSVQMAIEFEGDKLISNAINEELSEIKKEIERADEKIALLKHEMVMLSPKYEFDSLEINKVFSDLANIHTSFNHSEKMQIIDLCISKIEMERIEVYDSRLKMFSLKIYPTDALKTIAGVIEVVFSIRQSMTECLWKIEKPFFLECRKSKLAHKVDKHRLHMLLKLKERFMASGMTQVEFAKLIGMERSMLSKYLKIMKLLSDDAKEYILELRDKSQIFPITYGFLNEVIKYPQYDHLSIVKKKVVTTEILI